MTSESSINTNEQKQSTGHMPGPWHLDPDPSTHEGRIDWLVGSCEAGGYLIASVPHQNGPGFHNAQLIAAAPKLLEALERLVEHSVPGINPLQDAAVLSARAAIQKAKGGAA